MSALDFAATRTQIIEEALRILRVLPFGQAATSEQMAQARLALDLLVKNLSTLNIFVWRTAEATFNTVDGTTSYTPAEGIIGVEKLWIRDSNSDTMLEPITWDKYLLAFDNKATESQPEYFCFRVTPGSTTISTEILLYPTPDAVYTIRYVAVYKLKDYDNASDTNLVPSWWERVLKWQLAAELAPVYGVPESERQGYLAQAEDLLQKARIDNWQYRTGGEIYIEP